MSAPSKNNALDHVVVLMFENRSFDNLLGHLYEPGEVESFEGVIGKDLSNPIPSWAAHGKERGNVPYSVASTMNMPNPDPGEEFPHINTQLFGILEEANRFVLQPEKSFNDPEPGQALTMDGFVADYISMLTIELGRQPTYDEYAQIMTGYTPQQMPVVSTLARGFATYDHWFCEVPSCTFPNRSFFHAATSSGYVVNMSPADSFPAHNTAETIFDRLDAHGLSWRVYVDPPSVYSLTGIIHAARLRDRFGTHFCSTAQFFEDTERGNLPNYAFIEPNIIGYAHNDMHPPFSDMTPGMNWDLPSSLLGGEELLARVYNAIRSSSSIAGSNYANTFFVVTFDEHGGTYDHVPPPSAAPPDPTVPAGQFGFRFDRSGVRIPTFAVSAWIPERTVVTDEYRATSMIRTLRDRWQLGPPFTARDATARSMTPVLTLDSPRPPEDWPDVVAQPIPQMTGPLVPLDAPLGAMARALYEGVLSLAQELGETIPDDADDPNITGSQAVQLARGALGNLFPGIR